VVTIRTTSLTFKNSTFCPHRVFGCSVWISKHSVISLYSINWLVFIRETESVYCAVRTELNILNLQSPVVTICTTGLTFNNSTLSTQCTYVFCTDLRQTAIISLYNINSLVFITEKESVYCAVRTGSLNIVQISLVSKIDRGPHNPSPIVSSLSFTSWEG